MRIEPSNEPKRLVVKLTNQCNMACSFCAQALNRSVKTSKPAYLSFEQFASFFETPFADNKKILFIWGGEPLLHPCWKSFASYGKIRGWRVQLNTNGWLLQKNLQFLPDLVDDLIISLDGLDETHDKLRRKKGAFKRIEDNINKLSLSGSCAAPSITINTVITEALLDELLDFTQQVMSWNVRGIVFELPTYIAEDSEASVVDYFGELGWFYDQAKAYVQNYIKFPVERFLSHYKQILSLYGSRVVLTPLLGSSGQVHDYFTSSKPLGAPACPEINLGLVIEPDGKIIACSDFPDTVIGTYIGTNWREVWQSPAYQRIREAFLRHMPPAVCSRCCQIIWEVQNG